MLSTIGRRGLVAALVVAGALALAGGVTADTGALPAPLAHDSFYTWPGAQLLQVTPYPWGAGYIRNLPLYYVDCPYACIRPFDTGATVTLTAVPSTGYTFVGWEVANHGGPAISGACPGVGTCTVTIDQSKDVVALFSGPPPQPVGVDTKPKGCGRNCD
jgi:Divergent InlB B-repeat domain